MRQTRRGELDKEHEQLTKMDPQMELDRAIHFDALFVGGNLIKWKWKREKSVLVYDMVWYSNGKALYGRLCFVMASSSTVW